VKLKIIGIGIFLSTIVYAQTGKDLFGKNCFVCHANVLGVTNDGGYENNYITPAPYVAKLVKKLKEKTGTKEKFNEFIKQYIQNPDKRKSLYGKRAIKKFGLMPSLEGSMNNEEITKLTDYLYNYNNKKIEQKKHVKEVKVITYEEKLFNKYCFKCHANILGVTNDGGYENNYITPAPYIKKLVAKLKEKTNTKEEFVGFITQYIQNPDKRKSLYGKRAIKKFGLMPSLKDAISQEDAKRLANYLYNYNLK